MATSKTILLADIDIEVEWNSRTSASSKAKVSPVDLSTGLAGLATNLEIHGQTTPVDVRAVGEGFYRKTEKSYSLVCGFRRVEALRCIYEAGKLVPGLEPGQVLATDHGVLSERAAILLNARENANREPLSAPDRCALFFRLASEGVEPDEIANSLGYDVRNVKLYTRVARMSVFPAWHKGLGRDGKSIAAKSKRLAIDAMVLIVQKATDKTGVLDDEAAAAAYWEAADHSSKHRNMKQKAKIEKATEFAIALAKLVKQGSLKVCHKLPVNFANYVNDLSFPLEQRDVEPIGRATARAYELELARVDVPELELELEDDGIWEYDFDGRRIRRAG